MQYASKRFRDATMHVLEGASHSAYYEAPAAWNDLVLAIADGRVR
jgi:pimeloyl-ACP methyl ester carboxylesterase